MITAKAGVLKMIQEMPDDATLADIFDAVRLRHAIEESRRQVQAGMFVSDEELQTRLAKWLD